MNLAVATHFAQGAQTTMISKLPIAAHKGADFVIEPKFALLGAKLGKATIRLVRSRLMYSRLAQLYINDFILIVLERVRRRQAVRVHKL